jgi:hypothetical protein
MANSEIRELVEAVLERLATEETPQTACIWWDVCADDPCCHDVCADDPCCHDNPCADDPCVAPPL